MAIRVKSGTTVANTVSTVSLPWFQTVEVLNLGTTVLYATTDGSTPTVGGDDCDVIPPNSAVDLKNRTAPQDIVSARAGSTTVKLISGAAVAFAVTGEG